MLPAPCILLAEAIVAKQGEERGRAEDLDATLALLRKRWDGHWIENPMCHQGAPLFISAILRKPQFAFDFAVALQLERWPQRFKVVATDASRGEAKELLLQSKASFTLQFDGLSRSESDVVQSAAQLHAAMMQDWKPSRAKAASAMRHCDNQLQAAARLGIRQQSVSEALRAGHFKQMVACEDAIRARLNTL